ncbi:MAG: hypothetical protein J3K34DRAFT_504980 [Monoraphidium minutum]|nr:MAG: hypothetical protein J3K34DRAFT_504980 [Monoraphidium minutum]
MAHGMRAGAAVLLACLVAAACAGRAQAAVNNYCNVPLIGGGLDDDSARSNAACTYADVVSLCNVDANVRTMYEACTGALPRTAVELTATICGVPTAEFSDLAACNYDDTTTAVCAGSSFYQAFIAACNTAAGMIGDPHLTGFGGHKYAFCEEGNGAACLGRTFSTFSSPQHALNTRITRMAGPDAWPHAGAWMTAYGFRYADVLTLELELATDVDYAVAPDGRGPDTTRAVVPADWRSVFAGLRVNGKDTAARIGSGETLNFGAAGEASVHFPSRRHAGDATDGPVVVIKTPGMQVKAYLESEDVTHLDFEIALIGAAIADGDAHGLLGQSLGWAPGAQAALQGHEMDYVVEGAGGLLATAFKYSRFEGAAAGKPPASVRRMFMATGHAAAGGASRRGGSLVL